MSSPPAADPPITVVVLREDPRYYNADWYGGDYVAVVLLLIFLILPVMICLGDCTQQRAKKSLPLARSRECAHSRVNDT